MRVPHSCSVWHLNRVLVLGLFAAIAMWARAEAPVQPLRVAIVGLEHGHVEGFLAQLPRHSDVQLVGIADADTALWKKYGKKYSLPDTLFFKSMANMIEVRPSAGGACLHLDRRASSRD